MPVTTFNCTCGKQLKAPEELAGRVTKCPGCGRPVTVPAPQAAIQPRAVPAGPRVAITGQPPLPVLPSDPGLGFQPAQTSGKAIASLVLGLASFCMPVLLSIPAIFLGMLSLKNISQSQGRLKGKGLAIPG